MPRIKRPVRSFVEGTRRGYAYGLKDGNERTVLEYFVHDAKIGVDAAYKEASQGAATLIYTWKNKPRLIYRSIEQHAAKRNRKNRNPDTSGWEHSMDHLSRIAGIVTRMINAQNQGLHNDYEAAKRKYNVFAQRALDAGFTEADIDKAGEVGLEGVTTASW